MRKIKPIQGFEKIKLLSDPRRLAVLRRLMKGSATLTQLAQEMGQSAAWVRHHIVALESAELVHLAETRRTGRVTEKFYATDAGGLQLQQLVLPDSDKPVVVFSGSHDLALEQIGDALSEHVTLLTMPVGSLDGLVNLRQGLCELSGAHLLDRDGSYNTPWVERFFPDRAVDMVTMAWRTQGFMVSKSQQQRPQSVAELADSGLRFVNRNAGSGTRLWLDGEICRKNIPTDTISGYDTVCRLHTACAEAVLGGSAEIAIGLQAAAHQHDLAFIPLFEERYDLILPREHTEKLSPLLDYIQTAAFRRNAASLTGYATSQSGQLVAN